MALSVAARPQMLKCSSQASTRTSSSCPSSFSLSASLRPLPSRTACSLSFSSSFAASLPALRPVPRRQCQAGRPLVLAQQEKKKVQKKKVDSAIKRAKQAEASRLYNKARRTEMSTRMKKVFKALEDLRRSPSPSLDDLSPIEKLIGEAYAIIDKSVKVGTIHKHKGARRKSRLARAKRQVSIELGWYTPVAEGEAAEVTA